MAWGGTHGRGSGDGGVAAGDGMAGMERGLGDIGSGLAVVRFGLLLAAIEPELRLGQRRATSDRETFSEGLGEEEGPNFALLGLLAAFTFSGAASRFGARRNLITEEAKAMRNHPPWAIYPFLGLLCVVGSMWFGDSIGPSRSAQWLHRLSFGGITALALHMILDVEFPPRGLIRMEGQDAVWVELRRTLDARP